MNKLLGVILLSFSAVACSAENKPVVTPAAKTEEVKKQEHKAPEVKKKCVKVLDNKTNKEVEKCKTMKVHEKREGTKVPEKK